MFSKKFFGRLRTKESPQPLNQPSFYNDALISPEFRLKGVALSVLQQMKDELDVGATFHQAKDLIKAKTKDAQGNRSLACFLAQNSTSKRLVGRASYFVSYAWGGSFHDTVDALVHHFQGKPEPFLWIDIAMVDQFAAEATDLDFGLWAKTFRKSLREIGGALIVMMPGEKPIAITRSWCCFEWVTIKQTDIPFEYCVNQRDVERLISDMENGMDYAGFNDIFSEINVEKAVAWKPSDQANILELMKQAGIKEVNDVIMFSVKHWMLQVATKGQEQVQHGSKEGTSLLNAKASLHYALVRVLIVVENI